jgi:hypothetical protein
MVSDTSFFSVKRTIYTPMKNCVTKEIEVYISP